MTCFSAKRHSTQYVDRSLRSDERSRVAAHLQACDSCTTYFDQVSSLRSGLRELPAPVVPPLLTTRLRIAASREKQLLLQTGGSRLASLWNRWKFRMDEFMRPLTIPATGGLLSSVALFATLAFSITQTARTVAYEVPVAYLDRSDATLVPVDMRSSVVVTMSLDAMGRIRDYSVADAGASFTGDAARVSDNNIALPRFPSVMALARPISGDVRISLTPLVYRQ